MEFSPAKQSREIDSEPEMDRDDKHLIDESPGYEYKTPLCCCQSSSVEPTAPKDRFFLAYIAMFLIGMGVLFPWNSFVSALDYFMSLYRPYNPEVAIPITYLVVTLVSMGFTTAAVNVLPLHGRIGFGYVMFIIVLVFLPLFDLVMYNCLLYPLDGFLLTLCSAMLVGLGSGGECRRPQNVLQLCSSYKFLYHVENMVTDNELLLLRQTYSLKAYSQFPITLYVFLIAMIT